MGKLLTTLTSLLLALSLTSQAQSLNGKIKGAVIDGSSKTIESSTITLLRSKDSSVIKMSVADKSGNFEFENIPEGSYLVSISAVGHQNGYSQVFEITPEKKFVDLKTIELIPQVKSLERVVVSSKKPLIEQKIDRTIVNVEASVTNVGNSALEVLEKSPGVTVDKDGNVSLKGKPGVQIYIDGKPAYLSGADLANMLRNMNADQLEQIEIMTNPPAKYDAAGNSGVINIKTKKNKQFGYNGSLTSGYTQGKYARFNEGGNFNYRNGKINLFTNLNYSRNHRSEELFISRNFREATTKNILSIFEEKSTMQNLSHFYSGKLGLDYFASRNTTLGVVVSSLYNPRIWDSNTDTYIYEPNGDLRSQSKSFTNEDEKWKNFSSNFNLRQVLDSSGQEITADLDYIQYRSSSFQPLYSYYYDKFGNPTGSSALLGDLPQDIKIYSGKADYTLPLKKGSKLEAGVKSSYVTTDNNAVYNNLINNQPVLDSGRSNHFVYKENINAAYVNYSRPLGKKWTTQLGLRIENTNSEGTSTGFEYDTAQFKFAHSEKTFKRNYTQLFPTVYVQYSANEKNQFVINYGRRINRPDYEDLNPFVHFLDIYTFEQGNPNLKPQFSHNIELTHTYNGFLNTTVNYSSTTDIIQQVIEQHENTNETFVKRANIASRRQVGLSVSAYKQITKWWSGNIYLNGSNNRFAGVVNSEKISIGLTMFLVQMQQQFKWGKGWGAELSGFYRTKGLEGVIFVEPICQLNAGLSKQVLKNKGSVRMNFRDLFAGMVFKGYSRYGNVDAHFKDVNDSRSVSVSFTYRFNKGKLKAGNNRQHNSASDEESRVKVGGNN